LENTELNIQITGSGISLIDPPELDYWEVDPDWNGKQFKSVIQAVRPIRNGKIPLTLNYPTMGNIIKIQVVTISGKSIEFVINNYINPSPQKNLKI
jgi:hypothetical protein